MEFNVYIFGTINWRANAVVTANEFVDCWRNEKKKRKRARAIFRQHEKVKFSIEFLHNKLSKVEFMLMAVKTKILWWKIEVIFSFDWNIVERKMNGNDFLWPNSISEWWKFNVNKAAKCLKICVSRAKHTRERETETKKKKRERIKTGKTDIRT